MKKLLVLLLLVLVACKPAVPTPQAQPASALNEPNVAATEKEVSPPQNLPSNPPKTETTDESAVSPGPTENTLSQIDPYTKLGCEQMLSSEQFASACNTTADHLVVTYKVGTKNCFINVKDSNEARLTAGVTLTGFDTQDIAAKEFQRRMAVLKVGADKSVGERAYTFPKVDRQSLNFLRRQFIIEVGSDTRLCSVDGLLIAAKKVDKALPTS